MRIKGNQRYHCWTKSHQNWQKPWSSFRSDVVRSGDPIATTVIIVEVRGHQIFIGCQKNSLFGENHHCLEVRNNKRVGGIGDSWSPYYYNHWKSPKIMRNSQLTSSTRLRGAIIPYLLPRFFMDYTFLLVVTYLPFPIIKKTAIIATRGPLKYDHQSW